MFRVVLKDWRDKPVLSVMFDSRTKAAEFISRLHHSQDEHVEVLCIA